MSRRTPHVGAACAVLFAVAYIAAPASAQAPTTPPQDEDVEVKVPPTPPQAPAPPAPPPAPPPTPPPAQTAPANGGVSEPVGLPKSTAPAGKTEALEAEGSNYGRPIRRGLRWWGFIQAQYERNQLSEDELAPGGAPLNQDQFVLRRGRLRLDRGWENAAAALELDATSFNGLRVLPRRMEASLFLRASADDRVTPLLALTAGITDLPFGAEIGESQRDRVFMERSIGSLALFPSEADIGVKFWGAYRFVNYGVALVNGQPLNREIFPRDPNDAKDIVGRIGTSVPIVQSLRLDGGVSFYTGRGFSPGREATKDAITWVDDNNNGFAEPHEFQGITGSAAVASQNFKRWALGLDLGLTKTTALGITRVGGEAVVASNLDRGLLVSDPITVGSDIRQVILTASAVQQITRWGLVGFRAAYYDPNSDVLEQRAGVFHIKDESFLVLSPTLGFTLPNARIVGQYDFVVDRMARDDRGVPTNAKNNQLTIRLQVDL